MEERGLVTDRMILPRFRAIWRRWHRGAALFGPYMAKLEHSIALRQQRRLAMERERREASIAVAAALNSRAAFLRTRAAPLISHKMDIIENSSESAKGLHGPEKEHTSSETRGEASKSNVGMTTRAGKCGVLNGDRTLTMQQMRREINLGLSKTRIQDSAASSMQRMRAELCWPVAPLPLPPPLQEPSFTPSNLALDGEHRSRSGAMGDRYRRPNHHSRVRGRRGAKADGYQQHGDRELLDSLKSGPGAALLPETSSSGTVIRDLPRGSDGTNAYPATSRQHTANASMAGLCPIDALQIAGTVKAGKTSESGKSRKAQERVAKTTDPMTATCKVSGWKAREEQIPLSKFQEGQRKQRRNGREGHLSTRTGEQGTMKDDGLGLPGSALDAPERHMNLPHQSTSSGSAYMPSVRPLTPPSELRPLAPATGSRSQVKQPPAAASVPAVWTVQQEMDLPFFF